MKNKKKRGQKQRPKLGKKAPKPEKAPGNGAMGRDFPQKSPQQSPGKISGPQICAADPEAAAQPHGPDFGTDRDLPQPGKGLFEGREHADPQPCGKSHPQAPEKPQRRRCRGRHRPNLRFLAGSS